MILSSAPKTDGAAIARALVKARVAACVNLVPGIESIYRWKGRVERSREVLLVIKTTERSLSACKRALVSAHPYEVPEILVVRADEASRRYARWVDALTA